MFLFGCSKGQYSFQMFTYPNTIPPHELGWLYKGEFKVFTKNSGSMFRRGDKIVFIKIYNKYNDVVFSDKHVFKNVSFVKAEFDWPNQGKLNIKIYEYGNDKSDDLYAVSLSKKGRKILKNISYSSHNWKLVK